MSDAAVLKDSSSTANSGRLEFALDLSFPSEIIDSMIALHLSSQRWIFRRTDRVEFIDTTTTKREAQFEFELPPGIPETKWSDHSVRLVPIGILKRGIPLRAFEVADETGARLSTLNKEENSKLMMGMLHRLASQQGGPSKARLQVPEDLERICVDSRRSMNDYCLKHTSSETNPDELASSWRFGLWHLLNSHDGSGGCPCEGRKETTARTCPDEIALRTLICDLWMGYLNVVALPTGDSSGPRRVLTVTHEERLASPDERRELDKSGGSGPSLGVEFGDSRQVEKVSGIASGANPTKSNSWVKRRYRQFAQPQWMHVIWGQWYGGDVASLHTEIHVPSELKIEQAFLYYPDPSQSHQAQQSSSPWESKEKEWKVCSTSDTGPRGHLMPSVKDDWELGCIEDGEERTVRAPEKSTAPQFPLENKPKRTRRGEIGIVSLLVSADSGSMRTGAWAVGVASFLLLVASLILLIQSSEFFNDNIIDGWITIMVFAPTIAATIAAQPTSHELSGVLVRGLRLMIAVLGSLPVLGAAVLALCPLGVDVIGALVAGAALAFLLLVCIGLLVLLRVQKHNAEGIDGYPLLRANPKLKDKEKSPEDNNIVRGLKVKAAMESFPRDAHMIQCAEGLRFSVDRFSGNEAEEELQGEPTEPITDEAILVSIRKYAERAGWELV